MGRRKNFVDQGLTYNRENDELPPRRRVAATTRTADAQIIARDAVDSPCEVHKDRGRVRNIVIRGRTQENGLRRYSFNPRTSQVSAFQGAAVAGPLLSPWCWESQSFPCVTLIKILWLLILFDIGKSGFSLRLCRQSRLPAFALLYHKKLSNGDAPARGNGCGDATCQEVVAIASTVDFVNGLVIDLDGSLFRIVDFQHVKPGKGAAFVRTKVKSIDTGAVVDKTFRAGEKVEEAVLEHRKMQYLYSDGDNYVFMDLVNYEQVQAAPAVVGEAASYLVENQELSVFLRLGKAFTLELPAAVTLVVRKAEAGLKGDTSSGATKAATLETGLEVQVPLFIEEGDTLEVDTRTGKYIERV